MTVDDERAALVAHEAMQGDDFALLLSFDPEQSWVEYLAVLERERLGEDLAPGRVPALFLLAVVDDLIVGRASIRLALTDKLMLEGGHIGYGVMPAFRRRGYATEILRQSLEIARRYGIARALVTCGETNRGSAVVIERCGGVLENVIEAPGGNGRLVRRYWIG